MVSPGLVPASQFAFEQKSRCGVTIRREKAPGTCEQPGLQPKGGERKGESSVRTGPHRGGGSGLAPARLGGRRPSFPEERERGGPVAFQAQQQSKPGRKGAWHKEPSLPWGRGAQSLNVKTDFLEFTISAHCSSFFKLWPGGTFGTWMMIPVLSHLTSHRLPQNVSRGPATRCGSFLSPASKIQACRALAGDHYSCKNINWFMRKRHAKMGQLDAETEQEAG